MEFQKLFSKNIDNDLIQVTYIVTNHFKKLREIFTPNAVKHFLEQNTLLFWTTDWNKCQTWQLTSRESKSEDGYFGSQFLLYLVYSNLFTQFNNKIYYLHVFCTLVITTPAR